MSQNGMDEVVARARGARADAAVALEVSLGRLVKRLADREDRAVQLQRAVNPLNMPAVQVPVVAGALQTGANAVLTGPEDGQIWDIRRVTLAGGTLADAAITVTLFRETPVP